MSIFDLSFKPTSNLPHISQINVETYHELLDKLESGCCRNYNEDSDEVSIRSQIYTSPEKDAFLIIFDMTNRVPSFEILYEIGNDYSLKWTITPDMIKEEGLIERGMEILDTIRTERESYELVRRFT